MLKENNTNSVQSIILFDGYCNLCNHSIKFIIRADKKKQFNFISLQSIAGQKILGFYRISKTIDSVIYVQQNHVYIKSDAFVEILKHLPFPWNIGRIFTIIPKKIRDKIYSFIAKNRKTWFGTSKNCRLPDKKEFAFFPTDIEL